MRRIAFASMAALVIAGSPALAQQTPTRSVDDYVCTFAGDCADEEEAASEDSTEAPAASTRGKPRTSSTRGFSLARPGGAKPAGTKAASTQRKTGPKPARQQMASTSNKPRPPVAAQGQRADLRLSFELGSATLTPVARAEAKVFAESLMRPQLQAMKFVIEGHTDAQGGREYNMDLSRRRAEAVAEYLVALGVQRDRLQVRGYGFDRPLAGRSASAQENRRVEAVRVS
jgi:OmpA-OmpF porin, OOP family